MKGVQGPNRDVDEDDYFKVLRGGENIAPYVRNIDNSW
jgi:hypothetical protein